jgi:putative addiction module killer protein
VHARIRRASLGNFGNWKPITDAKGVFEMREHYGPGYRIFYSVIGNKIVLLLIGSEKKDQDKAIAKATAYLTDYEERTEE